MAYFDSDGTITIDEVAAQQDIKRIEQAKEILQESNSALKQLISLAEGFKGETATAILEKGMEIQQKIQSMISEMEENQDTIRGIVSKYQKIDAELKAIMEQV